MSHDIRTPLNAIIGFTGIALKNIDNKSKVKDCLEKTRLSGDILLALINDVLEFSRIESGQVVINRISADVVEAFRETGTVLRQLAEEKKVELVFETGEVWNRKVLMDKTRVQRVLINVISNGIKYTPAGGFVKVTLRQLSDGEDRDASGQRAVYRFVIADNGIGMSPEFQKHLFEEFSREENSTTSGVQGTGLGLALSKSIVQLLGGSIECESRQNEGSTFTITMPFELQDESGMEPEVLSDGESVAGGPVAGDIAIVESSDEASDESIDEAAMLEGLRALVVEDIFLNREIICDMLGDLGIGTDCAENGKTAIDILLEKGIDSFDFILMDIQMPVMDGYEAVREIKRLFPDSPVPVIALSANAFEEDKKKSKAAGMAAHIAKPIDFRELKNTLLEQRPDYAVMAVAEPKVP